jgi:WD40 repeat protein
MPDLKREKEELAARPEDTPSGADSSLHSLSGDPSQASCAGVSAANEGALTGHTIGDYEIRERIAQGGMGEVYKARQISLNRFVALKMILSARGANPSDLQRFRIEVEAAASLDHPRLVPIYEVGEHHGLPWFSMKLIHGGSLAKNMDRFHKDHRAAARFIVSAARGIHYAHQRGILHRDLKPANILLDEGGRPHVTDFGVAKRLGTPSIAEIHIVDTDDGPIDLTQAGEIVGTPSYMAPEQASGKKGVVTLAADIYSIGAILYEMLTGRPPFKAPTRLATLAQVMSERPIPPRTVNPSIDRDLAGVCLKCLEHDPARRYASADELADDLERWLAGQPVLARPLNVYERTIRWAKRSPAQAALVLFTICFAFGSIGAIAWQWQRAEAALARAEEVGQNEVSLRQLAENALREQQIAGYFHAIEQADRLRRVGRTDEALALLQTTDAQRRGWEFDYLLRACSTRIHTVNAEWGPVRTLALRPGSPQVAVAAADGLVRLIDLETGKAARTFAAAGQRFSCVACATDGTAVAAGSEQGQVWVWDAVTGDPRSIYLLSDQGIRGLDYAANGGFLAVNTPRGSGGELRLYPVSGSGEPVILANEEAPVRGFACNATASRVALIGANGSVVVFATKDGARIAELRSGNGQPTAAVFERGDATLAIARDSGDVVRWDLATGQVRPLIGRQESAILGMRGDAGKRGIQLVLSAGVLRCFSASGQELHTLRMPDVSATAVALPAQGGVALADAGGRIFFSPNAAGPEHAVAIRSHLRQSATAVVWLPRKKRVLNGFADGAIVMWDAANGKELMRTDPTGSPIVSLAASGDESLVAAAQPDGAIRLFNIDAESESRPLSAAAPAVVALDGDATRLAVTERDGKIAIYDVASGTRTVERSGGWARPSTLAFGPGDMLAIGGQDGVVDVIDARSGQPLRSLRVQMTPVTALAMTSDRLFLAGPDGSVRIADAASGRAILTLAPPDAIACIALTIRDGRLFGLSADFACQVWDGSR